MKKRHERIFLCALLVFSLSCGSARVPQTGFLNRTLTLEGTTYRYVVYVPASYDGVTPLPVLLFLHGAGERGDDGLRQTEVGLGRAIRWQQERFPMIVVFPQAPADTRWLGDKAHFAVQALEQAAAEFGGDAAGSTSPVSPSVATGRGTWLSNIPRSLRPSRRFVAAS